MGEFRRLHVAYKAVLLAFALLALGLLFRQLVTLLVAVLITVLIAIPLATTATILERYRIPRPVGALAGLVAGIGVLAGLMALVIPPFVDQTRQFAAELPAVIESLQQKAQNQVELSEEDGAASEAQQFLQGYVEDPSRLIGPLTAIGVSVFGVLAAAILIVLTAYYMAIRPEPLVSGVLALFPPARREWAVGVMTRLRGAWIGWMQGVAIDMLITGVLLYIGLTLIDIEFALVFAVFSAVMVLIPYFGAIAGALPPVAFALADSPGKALLALAIYVGVQQIESNITIPLVMAQRVKLHPALVAIGVVVVGTLFGFIGLFVAVPILAMLVIVVDELWVKPMEGEKGLRPVSEREVVSGAVPLPGPGDRAPPSGEQIPEAPRGS